MLPTREDAEGRADASAYRAAYMAHAATAGLRTALRAATPVLLVTIALSTTGHARLLPHVLAVATPAIALLVVLDARSGARRLARVLESLELAELDTGGYWSGPDLPALARSAKSTTEDFLIAANAATQRAALAAQQEAQATRARLRFSRAGVAEVFSQRIQAEESLKASLAAELHDTATQTLVFARWALESGASTKEVLEEIRTAEEQVRAVIAQTRPPELDTDLAGAVRDLMHDVTSRHEVDVTVSAWPTEGQVSGSVALTIYRFYQEGLANVAKHSGARTAQLSLTRRDDKLLATVTDQGVGFNTKTVRPSAGRQVGLKLQFDRARTLGGRTHVTSTPGAGTTITLVLPLDTDAAEDPSTGPAAPPDL